MLEISTTRLTPCTVAAWKRLATPFTFTSKGIVGVSYTSGRFGAMCPMTRCEHPAQSVIAASSSDTSPTNSSHAPCTGWTSRVRRGKCCDKREASVRPRKPAAPGQGHARDRRGITHNEGQIQTGRARVAREKKQRDEVTSVGLFRCTIFEGTKGKGRATFPSHWRRRVSSGFRLPSRPDGSCARNVLPGHPRAFHQQPRRHSGMPRSPRCSRPTSTSTAFCPI